MLETLYETLHETYTTQIIMSVIGGLILFISEVLPFIKSIKSNGIIELLIKTFTATLNNNSENEPLLNNNNIQNYTVSNIESNMESNNTFNIKNSNSQIEEHLNILNLGIKDLLNLLNKYVNELQTTRQIKLQPIELYELNYIINYIKVNYPKKMFQIKFLSKTNKQLLISQGYVIDYDSKNDIFTIKW